VFKLTRTSGPFVSLAVRIAALPFALLAFTVAASAQTAPQLLPYTSVLVAGGSTQSYAAYTSSHAVACQRVVSGSTTTASGNNTTDIYGDGCLATEILLNGPRYAIADKTGAIFFSDYTNGLIRRVDPVTGIVTAVAGGAAASPANGASCGTLSSSDAIGDGCLGTAVKISEPVGLAFDASGNLYFADNGYNNVRKIAATGGLITTTGVITTVVGNGTTSSTGYNVDNTAGSGGSFGTVNAATQGMLRFPYALAFDTAGNLYIADEGNEAIEVVNLTAASETFAGITNPVPAGSIAKLVGYGAYQTKSTTVECPDGVYVNATNRGGCYFGNYTSPQAAITNLLDSPYGIALDASNNLYIANEFNNNAAKVTVSTDVLTNYAGLYPANSTGKLYSTPVTQRGAAGFAIGSDFGLAVDSLSNLYVTDALNGVIWRVDAATQSMYVVAGVGGTTAAATTAGSPCSSGSSFIAFDTLGDGCPGNLATFGRSGTATGGFASTGVYGITVDANADIFVGDTVTNVVREVASGTQFGNTGAQKTDYVDIHFAKNDSAAASGAYKISTGSAIFSVGTAACTTNSDNTTDCILPVTAAPTVLGPYSGVLTVTSQLNGSSNFPLSGNFVQSPVTRIAVTTAGYASCTGTIYSTTTPVTLTAAITANGPSAPTGTVTFFSNGTSIGSAALSNIGTTAVPVYGAVLVYTFTTPATDSITATYTPSTGSYFLASTSSASSITITSPTSTLSPVSNQQGTVTAGQTALYSFNITQTVYSGTLSFAVTGLPSNSSYAISPTTITGAGCSTTSTVALSIYTQAKTVVSNGSVGSGRGIWGMITACIGVLLALAIGLRRRRTRLAQICMALALLVATSGTLACGKAVGTVLQPATPTGTYTITVTGTSSTGTSPAPITFQLIVQ